MSLHSEPSSRAPAAVGTKSAGEIHAHCSIAPLKVKVSPQDSIQISGALCSKQNKEVRLLQMQPQGTNTPWKTVVEPEAHRYVSNIGKLPLGEHHFQLQFVTHANHPIQRELTITVSAQE